VEIIRLFEGFKYKITGRAAIIICAHEYWTTNPHFDLYGNEYCWDGTSMEALLVDYPAIVYLAPDTYFFLRRMGGGYHFLEQPISDILF
jgi:hypothetical protein